MNTKVRSGNNESGRDQDYLLVEERMCLLFINITTNK